MEKWLKLTSIHLKVVKAVQEQNIDLIVVGTRGRLGIKKMLLGSGASGLVTYGSYPVLVVK
jgi:nucleotide-binding universal stress UspA family protein